MEAKDTVMTGRQIDAEMDRIEKLDTSYTTAELGLCKAQAEITWDIAFKAGQASDIELIRDTYNKAYEKGKKAGEKKAVEWVNVHLPIAGDWRFKDDWQEFLKSEGIE